MNHAETPIVYPIGSLSRKRRQPLHRRRDYHSRFNPL